MFQTNAPPTPSKLVTPVPAPRGSSIGESLRAATLAARSSNTALVSSPATSTTTPIAPTTPTSMPLVTVASPALSPRDASSMSSVVVGDRLVRRVGAVLFWRALTTRGVASSATATCDWIQTVRRRSSCRNGCGRFASLSLGDRVVRRQIVSRCALDEWRYSLCAIGRYAPLFVAQELAAAASGDATFVISGGQIGAKVSWQLTGLLLK